MLNSVYLIGRLVDTPTLKTYNGSTNLTTLRLAVNRPFKNSAGENEADFFNITFWDINARNTCDYCQKGDLILAVCRLQTHVSDLQVQVGGETVVKKINNLDIIGERIVFLNVSKKKVDNYVDVNQNIEAEESE